MIGHGRIVALTWHEFQRDEKGRKNRERTTNQSWFPNRS